MKPKEIISPATRVLKACWVVTKSALHLPQRHEDHFERLAGDLNCTDIEVDGFSKLTPDQLAAVKKGVYDDVLSYVQEGKVMDFGCGTGRHLMNFTSGRYQCTGIDQNEGSLIRARAKLPDATFYNVNLLNDAIFIAEFSGSFDLIYSVSVLQYFQKWQLIQLFDRFYKLLKPGGFVHMVFPTPHDRVDKWAIDKYRKYTVSEITEWLTRSGFTLVRADQFQGVNYTGRVLAKK